MKPQRRFAPIGGRFEPESVAGFAGIYIPLFPITRADSECDSHLGKR